MKRQGKERKRRRKERTRQRKEGAKIKILTSCRVLERIKKAASLLGCIMICEIDFNNGAVKGIKNLKISNCQPATIFLLFGCALFCNLCFKMSVCPLKKGDQRGCHKILPEVAFKLLIYLSAKVKNCTCSILDMLIRARMKAKFLYKGFQW